MTKIQKNMVVVPVSNVTPEWLEKRRGVFGELERQLIQGINNPSKGLTLEQLQLVAEHKNPFVVDNGILLADWRTFYRDEFGIKFGEVKVPEIRPGFDRLLVIAKGLTIQRAYDKCVEHFSCWKWADGDLDKAVPTNDRMPDNSSYAVYVHDRVEADEEHKNKSAETIWQAKIFGITLLERLLFELKYFRETGRHLDIQCITLCSGSRYTDGGVLSVSFDDGEVHVYWYFPGHAFDALRVREVVS